MALAISALGVATRVSLHGVLHISRAKLPGSYLVNLKQNALSFTKADHPP